MVLHYLLENLKKYIGYRTRCSKNCFQKIFYKTGRFLRIKIADAATKSNENKIVKQETIEKLIISPENYSMAPGTLWNYYRDEINDDVNKNNVANNRITI